MSKHTPEPWYLEERENVWAVCCKPTRPGEFREVVFVEKHGGTQGSITARHRTDEELAANALLISKAPTLLQLCKDFVASVREPEMVGYGHEYPPEYATAEPEYATAEDDQLARLLFEARKTIAQIEERGRP